MITSFVVVIMLFIELLNVFTKGRWSHWLHRYKPIQVIIATLLGLIPGCFGGFAVVSMWTHGAISFGALVAALISGVGDEAFVMLVRMPGRALVLFAVIGVIAIFVGLIIDRLKVSVKIPRQMKEHLVVHEHEQLNLSDSFKGWKNNFRPLTFTRGLLIGGLSIFILAMITGYFEHDHSGSEVMYQTINSGSSQTPDALGITVPNGIESLHEEALMPFDEFWFNTLFIVLAVFVLITFFIVNDHFLEEHLWKHIIRQHVPKIAVWTFGALLLIHFLMASVDLQNWVQNNTMWILLLAVFIGLIPESGPHLVFITLFLNGSIPFSILLANSITQDGHASLPLLAESKRGFLTAKLINAFVGLVIGYSGILLGF